MRKFNEYSPEEHETLQHLDNSHRVTAIFQDIELYKRGKLSGEHLDNYLKLLEIHQSGLRLNKDQEIKLNMLLSYF